MNKVILMGRLTKDPELRKTNNGVSVANFQLAVDRRFKNAQGEREVDFIPIVCWRQQAEFADRFFQKGSRITLVGSIQVRNWTQDDGQRRYMTEVIAEEVYFADSKGSGQSQEHQTNRQQMQTNIDENHFTSDTDNSYLPFEL